MYYGHKVKTNRVYIFLFTALAVTGIRRDQHRIVDTGDGDMIL